MSTYEEIMSKIMRCVVELIHITIQNIWGGFFWLVFGTYAIWYLYRQRKEKDIWNDPMYGFGWIGAIGMLMVAISLIWIHLTGGFSE